MDAVCVKEMAYGFTKGVPFLEGISARFRQGGLSCLVGPNGSGKTTFLKVMAALLHPSKGEVTYFDRPLSGYAKGEIAKMVAFVPQKTAPAFELTALSYVLMGRTPHLGPIIKEGKQDIALALAAMEKMNVGHLIDRDLNTLSGGEMQRMMIAKALCQCPKVLLMDEPVASLDVAHGAQVMALLKTLTEKENMTVICVMHDLTLAAHFADDLFVLNKGRLHVQGDGQSVLESGELSKVYGMPIKMLAEGGVCYVHPTLERVAHGGDRWLIRG